ncbi:MAG: glycerate kinase [Armatimonadetes bacterium]|nr:glycerate kinase [Armatimonadota bacterium]
MTSVEQALFEGKPEEPLRRAAGRILSSALQAVDPEAAVLRHLRRRGSLLRVGGRRHDLRTVRRIYVVGAGKAGARMARAAESVLGDRITAGAVVVKHGYTEPLSRVRVVEAGHPLPDEAGVAGAEAVLDLAARADRDDLVLCLVSGGGSALLPAPVVGVTLQDKARVTDLLLRAGATIDELNTVRKHLSRVKGGQLARAAAPAAITSLILSDVVGSPLDVIASGPTVPDPTTYADAVRVLERYGVMDRAGPAVRDHLGRGERGEIPETPKPGDSLFAAVENVVVGGNEQAARAAVAEAKAAGFHALLLSTYVQGEAREVGRVLAAVAREIAAADRPLPRPACVVAGGETTVTVRGAGRGGRNQEVALGAALGVAGMAETLVVGFATDGTDGPTDAAGAVADGSTVARAHAVGLNPHRHLAANDSYPFFAALGDLIITGPTNTNVNDLMLVLVGTPSARTGP